MGEYEPHDSRNVTLKQERAPGEPPRTGPREGETPAQPAQAELQQDERGDDAEATVAQAGDGNAEAALREAAMEQDADELAAPGDGEGPGDRND
ncbi:MAG TPA: hypothetical protein VEB68_08455 [Croceibacterium sp.]|nr:hypothetical protein [Croceibacterium sp.]